MNSLKPSVRLIILGAVFLCLSSFDKSEYKEGAIRHFENVELPENTFGNSTNIEPGSVTDDNTLSHPFDLILKKVIEEDRFVDKLDSASFFTLPVGISVFDGAYSLVVYESVVHADHAEFNAFLIITNPIDGKKIRFKASNVTYSFSGGISSFRLELIESIKTNLFEHASFIWKPGTYAQWDCDGFNHIGLNARLELDSESFVQVNPFTGVETGSIQSDFFITLKDINDFVLDVSIPTFKIRGFDEACWF